LDRSLQRLLDRITNIIDGIQPSDRHCAPPGKWSPAEILEHLYLTYRGTAILFNRRWEEPTPVSTRTSWQHRRDRFVVLSLGILPSGRKAPAGTIPNGRLPREPIDAIRESLFEMDDAIARCEERQGRLATVEHPILGPLTGAEWRRFHCVHGRHHLRQIVRRARRFQSDAPAEVPLTTRVRMPLLRPGSDAVFPGEPRDELLALCGRLPAHFLFNAMQAISSLMYTDVRIADRMISRLSDLLRLTIQEGANSEIPLSRELELVEMYVEMEKLRFGDQLEVLFDIEPEALDLLVPPLLLQPLVENAIRHGMENHPQRCMVQILAESDCSSLNLEVRDNGPGFGSKKASRGFGGIGLATTHRRLQAIYGDAHRLTLRNRSEGGAQVDIAIPFRPASGAMEFPGQSSQDKVSSRSSALPLTK